MIEITKVLSQERLESNKRMAETYPDMFTNEQLKNLAYVDCPTLKPEVVEWLNENINPQKNGAPGWAMGNDEYRSACRYRLTLWFIRHSDARKFIKHWSSFGKATSYFNYFKDPIINLELDTETMKYRNKV